MFSHVGFTSLPVQNMDRAIVFWRDTIGLVPIADTLTPDGTRWVTMQIPGAPTLVHLNPVPTLPSSHVPAMTLVAPNVAASATVLANAGVTFSQPTTPAPWNPAVQMATFHDSEGNMIMMTSA